MNNSSMSVVNEAQNPQTLIKTAIILAAGFGKRMRPLTATRPKPLVEVGGKPLIDHALSHLKESGIKHVIVNTHYMSDQLEAHLAHSAKDFDLQISREKEQPLETGGGIKQALPLVKEDLFLVISSDNFWLDGTANSIDLLTRHWDDNLMDALLLLVPLSHACCYSGQGDFHMNGTGQIKSRVEGRVAPFVFSGIQLMSKRFLDNTPDGPFRSKLIRDQAIARGRLYGLVHDGVWFDVSTPKAVKITDNILRRG
ncbi:MAG: nucleotidyltransferase family protein [Zymomonas mobilis subsp. pomaceae]|uniref:Nucleotidyl transferase n=1 Tax=Zymomonas mobilis subsp. pomaceae (strain ATCC 29192 / DSM 22645 / JCM 10191 / CCUG 17912 / NBRC 13757 / NCIMB 11200 / NRRL B-4491 / Barker I) TaxID=579138 RepID=F8EU12_ZYMMT|nr:nucleotidyltransferase family protein [Zymomonas mobilis]AEI37092.1 Nucleotidyl transferase [Zymomonas mobilis subsp. pomaceae ATCC 29192]MDX5948463.1 nucleotidyltransferase family protein [Zymomonas mobilis subsp. pomaceae]GEB89472.1 mannose-1-phosphate guanylyltransferase [Zymomonas mobilis subsp. pomaceae]